MLALVGEKITLREFTREHGRDERYLGWLRDLAVIVNIYRMEYLLPLSPQTVEDYVETILKSGKDCFFAIHETEGDRFIGTQRIGHIDWRVGIGDIGIMIGERDAWGKGYATEAIRLACDYAFNTLSLRRLTGGTAASNVAMQKCFTRLGFNQEGCLRKHLLLRGAYEDHLLFGLLKDDGAEEQQRNV